MTGFTRMRALEARQESGFTLIELMVTSVVMLMTISMVYAIFLGQTNAIKGQAATVELQDNARFGMAIVARDVRNAGYLVSRKSALRIEDNRDALRNELDCVL